MSTALAERIHLEARARFVVRSVGDTLVLEPRLPHPFRGFFTTRLGGGSTGPFSSMNLDPRSAEDLAVEANRARIAQSVAAFSEAAALPSPEVLQDFDTISRLGSAPAADEELLELCSN